MTISLTFAELNARWPNAPHTLTEGMVATSEAAFAKYGIVSNAELADFMAQISEETGGGESIEENMNYTAARLCVVWPTRFPTLAAAAPFAHNPRALADNVYGGRYGNRPGTDDGYNFRGRGGIQITFHDWYAKIGVATGLDLISSPDLANAPANFLAVACAFWRLDAVNHFADIGDFRGETIRVNGALTNYQLRLNWRASWRHQFGLS